MRRRHSHLTADSDRLVQGVDELVVSVMVNGLTVDLVRESGVVSNVSDRLGSVSGSALVSTASEGARVQSETCRAIRTPFPEFKLGVNIGRFLRLCGRTHLSRAPISSTSRSIKSASLYKTGYQ